MAHRRSPDAFAAAAAQDAGPPMGQLILRRKWLLLFGITLGVGLGYLYYTQQPPVFRSEAWIQVTPNRVQLPTEKFQANGAYIGEIETQCDTIRSTSIIQKAVDDGNLAKRPEFGSREAALFAIAGGLSVQPRGKLSQTIEISYLGSTPGETEAVVDAIVKAYQEYIGNSDQNATKTTVDIITYARDDLLKDLANLTEERKAFLKAQNTPLLTAENLVNPHAQFLLEIESQKTGLVLRRTQLESRIDVITKALQDGGSRQALTMMINQLEEDGGEKSEAGFVADKLFPLMLERELLSASLGPDHPDIQTIDRQIEMTQRHLNEILKLNGDPREPRDLIGLYLTSMRYDIKTTESEEQKLQDLFDDAERKAEVLEGQISRLNEFNENIRRKDQLLNAIVKQLEEIDLFNTQGIMTDVITPASEGRRTPVEMPKYMCVGGALGLIFFAILAYLMESNDKSFRTPEDIREELGISVVGHVPVIPAKAAIAGSSSSPTLCTLHSPRSQSSEAFRLVRTSLFFGARNDNLRVIQITSPEQGDGKSTVGANLAVAVAQSGRRTLLIDADMRRPTVHRIFGLSNDLGIADVIGSNVDPQDAIRESETPNLSVMLCGPHPHNPAELLASNQFEEFLGWARDNYDFVIVDTPPLLAVSDPGNVASRVDGVLLTLRLGKRARAKGAEACEILERVGANILGVIINGVNARGDYGHHANYRYTSASPSQYGYGEMYYASDEPTPVGNQNGHSGGPHVNGHHPRAISGRS